MLELYHWEPNGFYLKPLIALEEKGATFTSRWFDPTSFEQTADGFPSSVESRLTLEREGPLLVADGEVISSTFFMLEYIAESVPGPALMPEGAYDRYRARAWGQFLGPVARRDDERARLRAPSRAGARAPGRGRTPGEDRAHRAARATERLARRRRRHVRRGRAFGAAPAAVAADRTPRIRAGERAVARGSGLFDRGYRRLRARGSAAAARA